MWDWLIAVGITLALTFLGMLVAVVILGIGHLRLRRRVAGLELRLAEAGPVPVREPEARPAPILAPEPERPEPPPLPALDVAASAPPPADDQNRPIVFREDRFVALGRWLRENWVYVVAALSLALAGIFFVQYGIENGLLSPSARVAGAVILGLALIAAGEWMRRRGGAAVAFLPAVFAGAGLVSIFAGVVAARQLYGLIGPETGLIALVAVSFAGVLLGWLHGPFLAAFGLIGAAAAPFSVGGESDAPYWLYAYFCLIAGTGLAIDAMRRWAWVSVLALVLGFGGAWFVVAGIGGVGWFALALTMLAAMAVLIPVLSLTPRHSGAMIAETLLRGGRGDWPDFPTRLAGGAVVTATAGLMLTPGITAADSLLAFGCLALLTLALILWSAEAPALSDIAMVPTAGFAVRLALEAAAGLPLAAEYFWSRIEFRETESSGPATASLLLGLALLISLAAAWRSAGAPWRAGFAALAALAAPVTAAGLELFWFPGAVIGAYPWALQVIAIAAVMAVLAERFARADGEDRRRAAYAVLSCLSLIALALFILVTKAALTLALGVLVAVAAALDRRFRLPEMGWFVQAGVLVLGWRLCIDPGLDWAVDSRLWEVWLAFGGALAGMALAWRLLPERRDGARIFLESGFAGAAALFVNVLLLRWLNEEGGLDTYWSLSLNAMPWLIVMLAQLYRWQLGGWLRWVRAGVATIAGLFAFAGLAAAVGPLNPLFAWDAPRLGPPILDRLFVAYALPALVIGLSLRYLGHLNRWLLYALGAVAALLAAVYVGLEIRRAWHGNALGEDGVLQGELYSYTLAMMVLGAGLLAAAILRRSTALRWAAMTVIALTVAKVFLIDAAGLAGLMRVVAFLGLGLALAGVAVLNRWAARQAAPGPEPDAA